MHVCMYLAHVHRAVVAFRDVSPLGANNLGGIVSG